MNLRAPIRFLGFAGILGLLALTGCTPAVGDISGEVTYKGEPVSFGEIRFVGEGAQQGVPRALIVRGKYTIKACPAGPVKVSIESYPPPDPDSLKKKIKGPAGDMAAHMKDKEPSPEMQELLTAGKLKHVPIPHIYGNSESSGLTYEVVAGPQTKDFPLDK
jgi:hypothetical protein